MKENLLELYKHRELLVILALRDIKVRYKQSLMGFLWAILMPVLIVSAGIMVRYAYALSSQKPLDLADVVTVAVKSVPWAFLLGAVRFSCNSLILNPNLVTKVYFPREIFPMAAVLSQLFDLAVASSVVILLVLVTKTHVGLQLLWAGPLLAVMIVLAVGIGLLVSAGSLFFRDVKYIVEVFLMFAIFFTPVFYDVSMFGRKGRWLLLNPVAPLLEGFSAIVRGQTLLWSWVCYSSVFAIVTIILAYVLFKRLEPAFAESI